MATSFAIITFSFSATPWGGLAMAILAESNSGEWEGTERMTAIQSSTGAAARVGQNNALMMAARPVYEADGTRKRHFCGTSVPLLEKLGIDASSLPGFEQDGAVAVAKASDGHMWSLRRDSPLIYASRPLTADEARQDDEHMERQTLSTFFTMDRLKLCSIIAFEMRKISLELNPDNPPARSKRREMRKRLHDLANAQLELMHSKATDSRDVGRRLKAIGVQGIF
jgi:hypothetical protein